MKVTNLTDVDTPKLRQHGLVAQTFAVGRALLAPGESADIPEEYARMLGSGLEHLVSAGACAVGDLPAAYQVAKANQAQARMQPPKATDPVGAVAGEAPKGGKSAGG
ncbi:hypothetical protein LVJ94_34900 [Pendulispora rubella]|uniref:Uncharacterized protein n=1 Tax=Pendulispora rubella TaxID=2741070 RepID=A0ABZ2KU51_9BACT